MSTLIKLIENHRLLAGEVFHELNELNQIDTSKFTSSEQKDIERSIQDLDSELHLRRAFISDLETLL